MSDQIVAEEQKVIAENSTAAAVKPEHGSAVCPMLGKRWVKGMLGMAVCCGCSAASFRRDCGFRIFSRSDRERGSEFFGATGLSVRHVSYDENDDAR